MADLKKTWTQTAKSFVIAFNDLGVSLADSVKAGRDIALDWAKKDNPHVQNTDPVDTEGVEIPEEEPTAEPAAPTSETTK